VCLDPMELQHTAYNVRLGDIGGIINLDHATQPRCNSFRKSTIAALARAMPFSATLSGS
jgi:hypothetical protein